MRKILTAVAFLAVFVGIVGAVEARYREVDAVIFNPVTDGGRYLTIHESSSLPQWRFNAGFMLDYARQPLEIRNILGRRPVVDDLLMANIGGALGFTDWFEAGVNVPVVGYETWADPDAIAVRKETKFGLGDVRLELKFRILDIERYHFGIAVVPYVTFPTVLPSLASKSTADLVTYPSGWINGKFAANEDFTEGGKLVFEGEIGNRVWLALNAGYQQLRKRQYYAPNSDAWVDDVFTFGLGAHFRINDAWKVVGELYGETVAKPFSNAFQSQRQTPMEGVLAVKFQPQNPPEIRGLTFTAGGGRGLISAGVGSPDLRVFFGVNFRKPRIVELPPPPPPAEVEAKVTEKIIITQKIHFEFNKSNIRPISFPILDDVVELLNKNPSIKKVEVGGHCDWIGSDAYNQRLSEARSRAVVKYLTDKGIAADRLMAKGYGESVPIADNNTTEGRAKNRRVEFTVLE
jgi:outer membrane protein OmpA-like peptidoglycan-associated protein